MWQVPTHVTEARRRTACTRTQSGASRASLRCGRVVQLQGPCCLLLLLFSGCLARPSSSTRDANPADDSDFGAEMAEARSRPRTRATGAAYTATRDLARELLEVAERYRVAELGRRSLTHRRLWQTLGPLVDAAPGMQREEIGRSVEKRALYAIHFGRGPVRVMLWSQMHGNEPTATLALADLINYVVRNADDPLVQRLRDRLTITAIPMLNPDGAERSRRENATGIDVNRDARKQASPEARALASLHARVSPRFGFNLHDQGRRVSADGRLVAISLLAPPHDPQRSDEAIRTRAKHVAAVMRIAADFLVDGRVTRFDDAFNPHAFGDAMQSWGTSTVLLESGVWDNDPENEYLRQVNFALLLTALDAIATGTYTRAALREYESLPANPALSSHRR